MERGQHSSVFHHSFEGEGVKRFWRPDTNYSLRKIGFECDLWSVGQRHPRTTRLSHLTQLTAKYQNGPESELPQGEKP